MKYEPSNHASRVEKAINLTNKIIVKSLLSDRGDNIRVMNVADLKNMLKSVFNGVYNELAVDAQRAYDYKFDMFVIWAICDIIDDSAEFKPRHDVEIEEAVTAFFEIDGKLQYREVMGDPFIVSPGIDESVGCLKRPMKMGVRGMRYNPYCLADRLEKADILTNEEIMKALQDERGDVIREMSHADLKRWGKDLCAGFYHELYAEAADNFEQACKDYVPKRDGIENDPRKNFKPKTVFEIEQEIKAYFKEQGMLN